MKLDQCDEQVANLINRYVDRLGLPTEHLWITTNRATYSAWLGRKIPSAYGGAYCFLRHRNLHAILIHLERIDLDQPQALEVVVAEELVHMRDHLDGDRRRHAKHGHDRIAYRVAELTGATLGEIRSALLPVKRRPPRYIYECPRLRSSRATTEDRHMVLRRLLAAIRSPLRHEDHPASGIVTDRGVAVSRHLPYSSSWHLQCGGDNFVANEDTLRCLR